MRDMLEEDLKFGILNRFVVIFNLENTDVFINKFKFNHRSCISKYPIPKSTPLVHLSVTAKLPNIKPNSLRKD